MEAKQGPRKRPFCFPGAARYNQAVIFGRQPARSIVLVGWHGCGASDIGRELSRRMRRQLIEWELEAERRSRRDFRLILPFSSAERDVDSIERRLMAELPYRRDSIIVLAPEAVLLEGWPDTFLENTMTVFIDLPFERLWQRLVDGVTSPASLPAPDPSAARADWERLYPLYAQAQLRLTGPPNPPRQARVILHSFYT